MSTEYRVLRITDKNAHKDAQRLAPIANKHHGGGKLSFQSGRMWGRGVLYCSSGLTGLLRITEVQGMFHKNMEREKTAYNWKSLFFQNNLQTSHRPALADKCKRNYSQKILL